MSSINQVIQRLKEKKIQVSKVLSRAELTKCLNVSIQNRSNLGKEEIKYGSTNKCKSTIQCSC